MHDIGIKNILKKKVRNTNTGKARFRIMVILGITLSLIWMLQGHVQAHEPIFGVGPRTIWKHGFGYEMGVVQASLPGDDHWQLDYHLVYGFTPDWSVTAETHQPLATDQDFLGNFGELGLMTKYRFYRQDVEGGVYHAALIGGTKFPLTTAGHDDAATGLIGGLSGAYEGRRWLLFGTGRYRVNLVQEQKTSPRWIVPYDVAVGFRPVLTSFYEPDVVLMAEWNGQIAGDQLHDGTTASGTGGSRLLAGIGAWITYRNWAFKPGIQLPVYNTLSGDDLNYRWVFAVEFHV